MSLASAPTLWKRTSPYLLAGVIGGSSVIHFVRPETFESIVPRFLGDPRAWVYASGVAESACAAGLLLRTTRGRAGLATAALFVLVFPANVQMALDSGGVNPDLAHNPVVAWGRLPLQIPLVIWALGVARRSGSPLNRPRVAGLPGRRAGRRTA